jgi:hypothetical protein
MTYIPPFLTEDRQADIVTEREQMKGKNTTENTVDNCWVSILCVRRSASHNPNLSPYSIVSVMPLVCTVYNHTSMFFF